jgi:predicted metal-dependent enzyme (double-stranded beta helix superfamily)
MDEMDKETWLRKRKEAKRNKLKQKHEQQKYHKIILKTTQEQFFEVQKISFWDGVIRIVGNDEMVSSSVLPFAK